MILLQIPTILFSIYKEHQWLKKVVKKCSINAVISDNRFGLYHPRIHCVYITHQLTVITGNKFSEAVLKKIHYWFIKRYTECWVPDFEAHDNVGGRLSHPGGTVPSNIKYIGCLSRFRKNTSPEIKYDLLVLLSGPEPQRTILEKILLLQLKQFNGSVLMVRGKPGEEETLFVQQTGITNFHVKSHLTAQALNIAIEQSKLVICRSGYTTIMDLIKLKKKAILIPTPGQTEQEYLGRYLMERKIFYSVPQDKFLLSEVLKNAAGFSFSFKQYDMEQYKKACRGLVSCLH